MRLQSDEITGAIINYAIYIHRKLGPGVLESVYEAILFRMLLKHGFQVERQVSVPFEFDGMTFDEGFRMDLLVERTIVIEIESQQLLRPVHSMQLLTY